MGVYICFVIVLSGAILGAEAERTSQKIYEDLQADYPCVRRLNATHQIGCSSYRKGDVGVIHLVNTTEDLDWLVDLGPHSPYVVMLKHTTVNLNYLERLRSSGKVNGIIIIKSSNDSESNEGFSPAEKCPNQNHGLYSKNSSIDGCEVQWNSYGEGIFNEDWPFAMFLVDDANNITVLIEDCFRKFNAPIDGVARDWPLCAVELTSNMFAAKDTVTCMRRSNMVTNLSPMRWCDPIGDYNVWSTLFPMNKSVEVMDRSIILIAARLDSYSMFYGLAPGADSAAIGIVTLLATAQILARELKDYEQNATGNVLFVLFNGEAFDYIGSSRMVYDMMNGNFPSPLDDNLASQNPLLKLQHLNYFLELNQLGLPEDGRQFYLHTDPISTADKTVKDSIDKVITELKQQGLKYNLLFKRAPVDQSLPPASLQTFIRKDTQLPGVVVTDHEKQFRNKYYDSIYDDKSVFNITTSGQSLVDLVSSVAASVAGTVAYSLTNQRMKNLLPDADTVREMLDCYLVSFDCDLFKRAAHPDQASLSDKLQTPKFYVGVEGSEHVMRSKTTLLWSYLTGTVQINVTKNDCKEPKDNTIFTYDWMKGLSGEGECVKSLVNISKAVSPAFLNSEFDSEEYSTWTESVWDKISMRVFLKPSRKQEVVTLVIGILVAAVSSFVVWFLSANSSLLFGPKVATC